MSRALGARAYVPPTTPLQPDEQSRLQTRALARWLTSGDPKLTQLADLDTATAHLQDHAGHLCAVVAAADGQVVARYPVIVHGQSYHLSCQAHDPVPPAAIHAGWPVILERPMVLARSAELRGKSVALSSRSEDLRSRSTAIWARAAATFATVMRE